MAFTFPPTALSWLLNGCGTSLLVLADALALPRGLARRGYDVFAVDSDAVRMRFAAANPGLTLVVARPEALPFNDRRFDAVFVHQILPTVAPGLALPEIARVLRPDGRLLISHLSRDDTVPWVRRLADLMHTLDRQAMSAPGVREALAPADQSPFFRGAESRDFRHWEPVTRDQMIAMVAATSAVRQLDEAERQRFLDAAAAVHDEAAGNNQLQLPYQLRCWRAIVNPDALSRAVRWDEFGLVVPL